MAKLPGAKLRNLTKNYAWKIYEAWDSLRTQSRVSITRMPYPVDPNTTNRTGLAIKQLAVF